MCPTIKGTPSSTLLTPDMVVAELASRPIPVRETIWPVTGDNTENIQTAINKVAARPLDAGGFRGAVLLKAGYYRMATPVKIDASGVVLRGEGMGDTGTVLIGTGTGRTPNAGGPGGGGGGGGESRHARSCWWRHRYRDEG
jgi:hypothetical protein